MEKIKIKLDTPEIPDEKILKYKNFENVYKMVKTGKPFFKSAKFIAGGSSVIIIATILTIFIYKNNIKTNPVTVLTPADTSDSIVKIIPPLKDKDVPWEYFTIENKNQRDIVTKSGTILHIPASAFENSIGNKIEYPVKIKYREFRNPVDFFLSGIPMNYDSCNTDYIFESAGMFEIGAEKDGIDLILAKNKTIDIDFLSDNNEGRFNFYAFDTTKGQWDYVGKDKIKPYKNTALTEKALTERLTQANDKAVKDTLYTKSITIDQVESYEQKIAPIITDTLNESEYYNTNNAENQVTYPVIPVLASKDKYLFKLDINKKMFPEFATYSNILFQVDDRGNKFDRMLYSVRWDQINLKPSKTKGLYNLYLSKKDTSVHLKVIPVFESKDYQQAINIYNDELAKNKEKKEQNLRNRQAVFNTQGMVNEIVGKKGFLPSSVRSVSISSLGVFNCDYPLPQLPNILSIQFIDSLGKNIAYKTLYIADLSKNLLGAYAEGEKVKYKKGSDNVLWILTPDGKIGIVKPELFSEITNLGKPQIKLTILENAVGIRLLYLLINS